ncbi:MAG: hypothetical protein MH204_02855 [Fimbriimonadaceae bacterium]|nr:hypothetical protein [Fimbriimonadaceae bacterium]
MNTGFLEYEHAGRPYVVFVPREAETPPPAILFLHGSGESGTDGLKQILTGLGSAVMLDREKWPFQIVFPQKPDFRQLWPTELEALNGILREVEQRHPSDPHRRYLTGLSQGGHAVFNLADKLHWQFAACAPVCGWLTMREGMGAEPPAPGEAAAIARREAEEAIGRFRSLPIWAFHGGKDGVVGPGPAEAIIRAIAESGGDAKFTLFPEADHNSWDPAYRTQDLGSWFLRHTLR